MSRKGALALALSANLALAVAGCDGPGDPIKITRSAGGGDPSAPETPLTAFGHLPLSIRAPGAPVDATVSIGGQPAYNVGPDPRARGRLVATPMGQAAPGPADIVISWEGGELSYPEALQFAGPIDPLFDRYASFGASLTQGIQSGSLGPHGQLATAAVLIARQAGAYAGVPLVKPDLLPLVEPGDLTPDCEIQEGRDIPSRFAEAMGLLVDDETGVLDLREVRVAPASEVRNVGVGGSNLPDILNGAGQGSEPALAFMEHLAWDPETSNLFDAVSASPERSQIEMIEQIQPTLVVSLDMLDNELMDPVTRTDDPANAQVPTAEELRPDTEELVRRAAAAAGQVFIGDVPPVSFLPEVRRRAQRIGKTDLSHIDSAIDEINAMLRQVAAEYDNVHIVGINVMAREVLVAGVELADGTRLTGDFLGGLLSLDHTHFSDSGYALMANAFLDAIEEATGVQVPRVDLDAVAAQDPVGPLLLQPPPCSATVQSAQ